MLLTPEENQIPEGFESVPPHVFYEKLSTARLLTGFYLENRLFEMQVYLMLLHRCGFAVPASFQDWQRQSRALKLNDLQPLYDCCHDDVLVRLMVFLKTHWYLMLKELYKRFQDKPGGMAVLTERLDDLERLWIQKRRLKIDVEDVKQDAWNKGLELVDRAKKSLAEEDERFLSLQPPILPVKMDEFEAKAWRALVEDSWTPSLRAAFSNIVPLIRGDIEAIGSAVDNFLRENSRKAQRDRKILQGKEKFPVTGQEASRADWDFEHAAEAMRAEDILPETSGEIVSPEDSFARREVGSQAYEFATAKWGEPGKKYLETLIASEGNVSAASEAAGVSRVTGHKWRKELEFQFFKKNPPK
jgi:hypothetical protein